MEHEKFKLKDIPGAIGILSATGFMYYIFYQWIKYYIENPIIFILAFPFTFVIVVFIWFKIKYIFKIRDDTNTDEK